MAEAVKRIPYDEFASHLADFFERVTRDNETILVEREDGEAVVLKPVETGEPGKRKRTKEEHEAFLASAGGWSDVDAFLEKIYESRNMPPRPLIEL